MSRGKFRAQSEVSSVKIDRVMPVLVWGGSSDPPPSTDRVKRKLNKKLPDSFKLPRHITEEKSFSFSFLDLTLVTGEQEWVLHNVSESENKQISLLRWTPKQEVESKKDQLRTQRVQLNNERRTEGSVPSVPSLSWDPYDVGRRFLSDDSSLPAVDVNPASSSLEDRTPKVPEPLGHLNKEALNRNLDKLTPYCREFPLKKELGSCLYY